MKIVGLQGQAKGELALPIYVLAGLFNAAAISTSTFWIWPLFLYCASLGSRKVNWDVHRRVQVDVHPRVCHFHSFTTSSSTLTNHSAGFAKHCCMFLGQVLFRASILTLDVEPLCRSSISWSKYCGIPIPCRAFQRANRSMESKAAFRSTKATRRGWLNSRWTSDNSCRARMASSIERPEVNPDCSNLLLLWSRASILLSSTSAKTLPGTDSSMIGR